MLRKWFTIYLCACAGLVLAGGLGLWAADGFDDHGLSVHGLIALVGGSALMAGLTIGLMALVFHSNRSGHDDEAAGRPDRAP